MKLTTTTVTSTVFITRPPTTRDCRCRHGQPAYQLGGGPVGGRLALHGRGGRVPAGGRRAAERGRDRDRADANRGPAGRDGVVLPPGGEGGRGPAGQHPAPAPRHPPRPPPPAPPHPP